MPEGHTIHRLAKDLAGTLGDGPVHASSPQGRFTEGAALINAQPLTRSDAWGKYLFIEFGGGTIVHIHLGLIGKLRPVDPDATPGESVRLRLESASGDAAWQLTGPTRCEIVTPQQVEEICAPLGADPLRKRPDVGHVIRAFARKPTPVGSLLLDQTVIAGIGNVYRAELLFIQGIHPLRPANQLTTEEVEALWAQTVFQLKRGVKLNRIVTTDPKDFGVSLAKVEPEDRLYVYHRSHCRRCGTELRTLKLSGRPIQFCPTCQPD
jgi:endonuclease-8